jgi:dihydroorotase/N-acyl-D-amino-acid deacylase
VDGTGAPWFRADVCVAGDRIVAVGDLGQPATKRRIDATALVVAPGFIDMLGQSEYYALVDPRVASKVTQGITSEITGEGTAIAPRNARMDEDESDRWKYYGVKPDWTTLGGYWKAFRHARPAINLGTFVGAGLGLLGFRFGGQPPFGEAVDERDECPQPVAFRPNAKGAFGLSTSLIYVPIPSPRPRRSSP